MRREDEMSDFKAPEVKKALAEHLKNPPSDSVCYYFMLYMEITNESKTFENFVTRIDEEEIHGSWDFLKGYDIEQFTKCWISKEEAEDFIIFVEQQQETDQEVENKLKKLFEIMKDYDIWPEGWGIPQKNFVEWCIYKKFKLKTFKRITRVLSDARFMFRTFDWRKLSGYDVREFSQWIDEEERKSYLEFSGVVSK
jgi:hypothetical protein